MRARRFVLSFSERLHEAVVRDGLGAVTAKRAVRIAGALNVATAESLPLTPRNLARWIAEALQKARS